MKKRACWLMILLGAAGCTEKEILLVFPDACENWDVCGRVTPSAGFVISGTVTLAGAPVAARVELVRDDGTTWGGSTDAPFGTYSELPTPPRNYVCHRLRIRATLVDGGRQRTRSLSERTGQCRIGSTQGSFEHQVLVDFSDGPWLDTDAAFREVAVGGEVVVAAILRDRTDEAIADGVVSWTSSNPTVASVSEEGRVTGASPGVTHLVATANGVTDSVMVHVYGLVMAYAAQQDGVSMVDLATQRALRAIIPVEGSRVELAVTTDRSRLLIVGDGQDRVAAMDLVTRAVEWVQSGVGPIGAVTVAPDGRQAYFGSTRLSVLDMETGAVVNGGVTFLTPPSAMAVSPDGSLLFVAHDGGLTAVDLEGDSVFSTSLTLSVGPRTLRPTPDGTLLLASGGRSLDFVDVDSWTVVDVLVLDPISGAGDMILTSDGTRAYIAHTRDMSVVVVDVASRSELTRIPMEAEPFVLAITPDEREVYVSLRSDVVRRIDTRVNRRTGPPIWIGGAVRGIAISGGT